MIIQSTARSSPAGNRAGSPTSWPRSISSRSVPLPGFALSAQWAQRLIPSPRTAAFRILDPDFSAVETLADPATDAPVIRREGGGLSAAVPQRLPATSPLTEIILDDPIWVRVADGTLYLAPKHSYYGLSWGYSGSGPGSLALLIDRLLTNVNSAPADSVNGAAEGLEQLTQTAWSKGTVLTRAQLEAARDGRPHST